MCLYSSTRHVGCVVYAAISSISYLIAVVGWVIGSKIPSQRVSDVHFSNKKKLLCFVAALFALNSVRIAYWIGTVTCWNADVAQAIGSVGMALISATTKSVAFLTVVKCLISYCDLVKEAVYTDVWLLLQLRLSDVLNRFWHTSMASLSDKKPH